MAHSGVAGRPFRAANGGSTAGSVLRFRNFVTPSDPNFQLSRPAFLTPVTTQKTNAQIGAGALLFKLLHP
jgi:hypothetical protein